MRRERMNRETTKREILLFSTMQRSFIESDRQILAEQHDVRHMTAAGLRHIPSIYRAAQRADLSICWFASVYALPLVLGASAAAKSSIIIIGGSDSAAMPAIDYGIWLSKGRAPILRRALRGASAILAVDQALLASLRRESYLPLEQGSVLPTGYDTRFWTPESRSDDMAKLPPPGILAVASCDSRGQRTVKALDLFCAAASRMPEIPFTLAGCSRDDLERFGFTPPTNLTALPELDRTALRQLYRRSLCYCQSSRHEGLPNALCEALLCELPAVASDVGGTRRALGDGGHLVPTDDLDALVTRLRRLVALSPEERGRFGASGRSHVVKNFPIEERRRGLLAVVDELLDGERR